MKYDLIVIGGGPGGLMAAKTAAEDGLKVVLVERKRDPAEISRACLQLLYLRPISPLASGKTYREEVNVEACLNGTRFHNRALGFSMEYTGQLRPYLNWVQISPGGRVIQRFPVNRYPWGFYYQKDIFCRWLLESALMAGAEIRTGVTAQSAENTPYGVRVKVKMGEVEETLEASNAIAADGNNSRVVDSLGLNASRKLLGSGMGGAMYVIEGMETGHPNGSFLSWSVPSFGPGVNVLCGQWADNTNCLWPGRMTWEQVSAHPIFAPMLRKAKLVGKQAYSLEVRTPLANPVAGNVIVIGDAAAPTETWIQGSVACAFKAVKCIESARQGQPDFGEYARWWRDAFAFNQPNYFAVISDYYTFNRVCSDNEVDWLFELFEGEIGIPGPLIDGAMERIKASRPDIHDKLVKAKAAGMWNKH
jgi:flavin-dependent dehydrogenase